MKFKPTPKQTVIINATNIGYKFHGIGVYSLNILKELVKLNTNLNFIIYLNKNAQKHFTEINFPDNFEIKWVTSKISPDYNFKAHLLRLLYSNYLSLKHFKYLQFNTSQSEINFFRTRQIVTIHDVIPLLFKDYHKKLYYYFKFILKYGLMRANYIITPSYHSKNMIKEIFHIAETRIRTIYNGAAGEYKNNHSKNELENGSYLIYIGRINKMKNLQALLTAYSRIFQRIRKKLVIISNDWLEFKNEMDSIWIRKEVKDNIIFKSNISDEEKCSLLSNAALFVFPSLYEGFGLPPIEAMACGCPVVASDNSSIREVCGDAAFYIDPLNTDSITNAILELNFNEKIKLNLIAKGLKRAENFKWESSASEHLNIFEHILEHNRFPAEQRERLLPLFTRSYNSVSQLN